MVKINIKIIRITVNINKKTKKKQKHNLTFFFSLNRWKKPITQQMKNYKQHFKN